MWGWGKRQWAESLGATADEMPCALLEGVGMEGEGQGSAKSEAQGPRPLTKIQRESRFGKKDLKCSWEFAEFATLLRYQVDR